MKRFYMAAIFSSFLVLFAANSAFAGGALKIGIDFEGQHKANFPTGDETDDVETGLSLSGEFFAVITKNFDLGGGITYQIPRALKDYIGDFNFIPIYGLFRIKSASEQVAPYFIGQIGYNFFNGDSDYVGPYDLDGGLYYGLGGGIIIKKHFLVELLYNVNNGTYDLGAIDFDIEYSKITLNIGFNF